MQTQISKLQSDVAEKESTIQKIIHEKRETVKQFDHLEAKNNALEEVLNGERVARQEAVMAMENMKLILAANKIKRNTLSPKRGQIKKSQNKVILEEDGIECFDLEMMQSDAQDDLRLSIGAQIKNMPPPMSKKAEVISEYSPEAELLSQLEKSKNEINAMMQEKEKLDRTRQEQELETKLEMRETIEMLKEESLIKDEVLSKYENQQKITEDEVSPLFN